MGKRIFILIIFLMSVALIGIISVQVYWIKNTIEITDEQFEANVKIALSNVSEEIKKREFEEFYDDIQKNYKSGVPLDSATVRRIIYSQVDSTSNEQFIYSASIIEQKYKSPMDFFEADSVDFTEVFSKEETVVIQGQEFEEFEDGLLPTEDRSVMFGRFEEGEKAALENAFDYHVNRKPIHQRVSNQELTLALNRALEKKGVNTKFKYGIYDNGLATPVKSGYFRKEQGKNYVVPMFADGNGMSNYQLFVSFPDKKDFIIASIAKILALSAIFILIIILSFVTALYQLIKQKQISEIKTDFINNMTHEFKTPIATINLALDAIKNPRIIDDKEKVQRYVGMIREENKRMHAQVENVLRISKLEKNQLDVNKEKVDAHDLIEEAIAHVDLIVKDKGGSIQSIFNAGLSEILANQFHMTNVFVNMFDNAIKYSEESPKVDILTESTPKNLIIRVSDEGIGMSKNVQKNIFKKFYREERGNVHNVKGHGLGLSYVKKIIEMHHGEIFVESEKGIGSTFTVKLPLI